jgi:tRNA(fMet)-specific endonuclease VapC
MSIVTCLELVNGAWKSRRKQDNLAKVEELSQLIPVRPLDTAVADHYGRIRSELERKGSSIGAYDLLIAAHALSLDLTLVTNNLREFARIPGLRVENWV